MNVQASESMNEAWVSLQGHVINGAFPLHRYLNGSEHTGVFLAESRRHKLAQVAVKLVRAVPTRADAQLSRWLTADGLAHPHLIRIFEAGRCQLGGLQYLYAVMEYADQNLAELLDHRALTEDEAREMLAPTLSALAFLHERKYVQGQLKPSNILVVGEQLKLASDTIRRAGESLDTDKPMTVYDPPESRGGSYWPAGDVWALGVSLCEALTRNRPVGLHDGGRPVAFPRDFPAAFREIVGRCLSRRPHDRPSVADVDAWVRGKQLEAATPAGASKTVTSEGGKALARDASDGATTAGARESSGDVAARSGARDTSGAMLSAPAVDAMLAQASGAGRGAANATSKVGTIEVSEAALGVPLGEPASPGGSSIGTGAGVTSKSGEAVGGGARISGARSAVAMPSADGASTAAASNATGAAGYARVTTAPSASGATSLSGASSTASQSLASSASTASSASAVSSATGAPRAATASAAAVVQPAASSSQPPVMTATAGQRAKPPSKPRTLVVTLAAVGALALIWAGARTLRTHQSSFTPPTSDVADEAVSAASSPQEQSEPTPALANESPSASASSNAAPTAGTNASPYAKASGLSPRPSTYAKSNGLSGSASNNASSDLDDTAPAEPELSASAGATKEVMPEVPHRARQTIRGHVKVSVRLIVDQDGSVFAALVDDGGPSRYFSRLAIEAAKKWTFAPADTDGQRLVQVRFDFTRDGATARAFALK